MGAMPQADAWTRNSRSWGIGGDLDKVSGKRSRFNCFPIRWFMGDGSMVRCVAEIDEDDLNDVPDRTYTYGGL